MDDERLVPTRKIIEELKDIIEYSNIFNKVEISKNIALTQENTFPSCYIKIDGTTNELNGNIGTEDGCEYDRVMMIRIRMFLEMSDNNPLEFLDFQDKVETAILTDNPLWKIILDRDIIGTEWDNDTSYPKKEGELSLLVKWRTQS
jgi:hypothetical protein